MIFQRGTVRKNIIKSKSYKNENQGEEYLYLFIELLK